MDINSRKVSKSVMERFGIENGVKVYIIKWLGQLRPRGQYILVIIKVVIKEDIEKLLTSDNVLFRGGAIIISPFKEQCTPIVYYKYKRFRYRARDCTRPNTCKIYRREGYL